MMNKTEDELVWIKKVERKGAKYLVYTSIDDEPLTLTEDAIVNNRIIKGTSFYPKDWKKIKESLDENILFDACLHFIDFKPRTSGEVREYLEKKQTDEAVINRIIKKLEKIKMLDDDRYLTLFIENELRKEMGPKAIAYSLINKGIDQDKIEAELLKIDEETFYNNAFHVATSTLKTVTGLPRNKQKETIYSRLLRMGYHSNTVNKVLNNISYSDMDMELLQKQYEKIKEKETDKNKIIQKLMAKGYEYSDIKKIID